MFVDNTWQPWEPTIVKSHNRARLASSTSSIGFSPTTEAYKNRAETEKIFVRTYHSSAVPPKSILLSVRIYFLWQPHISSANTALTTLSRLILRRRKEDRLVVLIRIGMVSGGMGLLCRKRFGLTTYHTTPYAKPLPLIEEWYGRTYAGTYHHLLDSSLRELASVAPHVMQW